MAVSSAGHATPEVLASTIGVLGRMGFADEMVLDSLARHLMPGVHNLGAEHIAQLVSAQDCLAVCMVQSLYCMSRCRPQCTAAERKCQWCTAASLALKAQMPSQRGFPGANLPNAATRVLAEVLALLSCHDEHSCQSITK